MSGVYVEVTRHRPCPICGKPDWCCFSHSATGREIVVCKRTSGEQCADTVGTDGRLYKFLGITKNENASFQEVEAWQEDHDVWMREHEVGPYRRTNGGNGWKTTERNHNCKDEPSVPRQSQPEYEIVDPVSVKSHPELDRFYRALLKKLVLDPIHRQYLKNECWSDSLIESSLVKSFPVKDVIRFNRRYFDSKNFYRKRIAKAVMQEMGVTDLRGYPGAYLDRGGNWTLNGPSGLMLPIYDADGYIYGLRIRMDFCDVDRTMELANGIYQYTHDGITSYHQPFKGFYHVGEDGVKIFDNGYYDDSGRLVEQKGKYRPFTSFVVDKREYENGRIVNRLTGGCQAENQVSVYFHATDNPCIAYFTEGEKKGIYANEVMHVPVITFPGVGNWRSILDGEKGFRMIDKLKAKGVQICVVAYDADKNTNANVLRQQNAVAQALMAEGFVIGIANWPARYGKGMDDMLAGGYMPGLELLGKEGLQV